MAKTGIKCKAYLNTGTYGSPAWTEIKLIGDLQVSGQWNYATGQTRETPVERGARTTLPLSVSGKIRVPSGADTAYDAMDDAFFDSSVMLDILILNGPKDSNGVTGVRSEWELTNWSEDQATGNVLFKDFELKPSLTTNVPQRVVVSGGVPAFSDIS